MSPSGPPREAGRKQTSFSHAKTKQVTIIIRKSKEEEQGPKVRLCGGTEEKLLRTQFPHLLDSMSLTRRLLGLGLFIVPLAKCYDSLNVSAFHLEQKRTYVPTYRVEVDKDSKQQIYSSCHPTVPGTERLDQESGRRGARNFLRVTGLSCQFA